MNTTMKEILIYLEEKTKTFEIDKLEEYSALNISEQLSLSRSIVSSYLNEMVNEGLVFKIAGRPVAFIHLQAFEQMYDINMTKTSFETLNDFTIFYEAMNLSFSSLIGKDGSLSNIVESIKNTVNYPGGGLPIIIDGKQGTGKTYLSELIFKYVIAKGISTTDTVYSFRASAVLDRLDDFKKVVLSESKYVSIIRIIGVDELSKDKQEELLWNLTNFTVGDKCINILQSKDYRILLTVEDKSKFSPVVEMSTPVVVTLPKYTDRPEDERTKLISKFVLEESKRLKQDIEVSENLVNLLKKYPFKDNISGLKNEIIKICAKGFSEFDGVSIKLKIYHVSSILLTNYQISEIEEYDRLITLQELSNMSSPIEDIVNYDKLNEVTKLFLYQSMQTSANHAEFTYFMSDLNDNRLLIGKNQVMLKAYLNIVNSAADIIEKRYLVIFPSILRRILASLLYAQLYEKKEFSISSNVLNSNIAILYRENYFETTINGSFKTLLELNLGIEINDFFSIISMLGILGFNKSNKSRNNISSIIMCHGDSTASSMANAVNKLIGQYIFDAINMPISTSVEEIIYLLKERLEKQQYVDSFIFLVDMGSLERINEFLTEFNDISIVIVNSVSTNIALHVGDMIKSNKDINTIYENIRNQQYIQSRLIENEKKDEIILFMGYEQSNIANYSYELFKKSLPRQIDINLMVANYKNNAKAMVSHIKEKGIVKHVIGVLDAELREIDYVDLTDLVALEPSSNLYETMSNHLSTDEIDVFKNNLIRNFSIENVVEHLTILNPTILIEEIEISLQNIENSYVRTLESKIKLGLYAHIAVAVERLVTNNQMAETKSTEDFELYGAEFIAKFKKSFKNIEKRYNIEFPTSEILYIYDFFQDGKGDI